MTATKNDILRWIEEARKMNKKYLLVITDTFDFGNYPVFANDDDIAKLYASFDDKNMQKIEEIYNVEADTIQIGSGPRNFDWIPPVEKEKEECKHHSFLCKECGIEVCDCREGYEETHPSESHRWDNDWN